MTKKDLVPHVQKEKELTTSQRLRLRFKAWGEGFMVLKSSMAGNEEKEAAHLLAKARSLRAVYDVTGDETLKDKLWWKVLYPAMDLYKKLIETKPSAEHYFALGECYRLLPLHGGYQEEAREAYESAISLLGSQEEKDELRKNIISLYVFEAEADLKEALSLKRSGLRNELAYMAGTRFVQAARLTNDEQERSALLERGSEAFVIHGDGILIMDSLEMALRHSLDADQSKRIVGRAIPALIKEAKGWGFSDEVGQGMIFTVAVLKYSGLAYGQYAGVPQQQLQALSIADMLDAVSLSDEQVSTMRKLILELERIFASGGPKDATAYRSMDPLNPELVSRLLASPQIKSK